MQKIYQIFFYGLWGKFLENIVVSGQKQAGAYVN